MSLFKAYDDRNETISIFIVYDHQLKARFVFIRTYYSGIFIMLFVLVYSPPVRVKIMQKKRSQMSNEICCVPTNKRNA